MLLIKKTFHTQTHTCQMDFTRPTTYWNSDIQMSLYNTIFSFISYRTELAQNYRNNLKYNIQHFNKHFSYDVYNILKHNKSTYWLNMITFFYTWLTLNIFNCQQNGMKSLIINSKISCTYLYFIQVYCANKNCLSNNIQNMSNFLQGCNILLFV